MARDLLVSLDLLRGAVCVVGVIVWMDLLEVLCLHEYPRVIEITANLSVEWRWLG